MQITHKHQESEAVPNCFNVVSDCTGGAAGFFVGLFGHDQKLPLAAVMTFSFLADLSITFLIRLLKGYGS